MTTDNPAYDNPYPGSCPYHPEVRLGWCKREQRCRDIADELLTPGGPPDYDAPAEDDAELDAWMERYLGASGSGHRWWLTEVCAMTPSPNADYAGTVTLDVEIIQQWFDWLLTGDEIALRHDLEEVLTHPERCQPVPPNGRSGT